MRPDNLPRMAGMRPRLCGSKPPGAEGWSEVVRCPMVEIIGLVTMVALVWLLAWPMAGESESERRRISTSRESGRHAETAASPTGTRHAA